MAKDPFANMGLTIATGFDLSEHDPAELKRLGLSDEEVLGFTDDNLGLPSSPGSAQSLADATAGGGSAIPASFNLYDWLHNYLNRPVPSKMLQSAEDWSQSFERNGDRAAGVGAGTLGLGLLTADPYLAGAGAGLFGIGETANKAGKVGDAVTSFLKSIKQDNNQPLQQFGPRQRGQVILIWKFRTLDCMMTKRVRHLGGQ